MSHYNVQPVFEVYADVQGRDLGGVSADVQRVVDSLRPELPRGSTFAVRGQVESMNSSFRGLAFGLLFAVLLVYFLMVVNFQSWLDPFIILTALPGALAGIVWMLYLTQTTVSVPALMGAIMCIGVATSNSILLITFANDQRTEGHDAQSAALAAGATRLRPVLMTALAMIIGMLPMSLGLGEGGEQNAPLGRAVIGGLLVATVFTLLFVPVMYSLLRRKPPRSDETNEARESVPREPGVAPSTRSPCGGAIMAQQQSVERPATAANETPANEPAPKSRRRAKRCAAPRDTRPWRSWGLCLLPSSHPWLWLVSSGCEHTRELNAAAAQLSSALPRVSVATARWAPPTSELTLPGEAQPIRGAALYGRVNGYLKGGWWILETVSKRGNSSRRSAVRTWTTSLPRLRPTLSWPKAICRQPRPTSIWPRSRSNATSRQTAAVLAQSRS